MKICYLGQQSWLISNNNTNVLIDPLLSETFGTSNKLRFRVYPPRSIVFDKMPSIHGVFITNEHLDHFHLPSLKQLDKNIPIYVGELMPICVNNAITEMGFNLTTVKNEENIVIGELTITFFVGNKNTPFWEKRVYQLYCRTKHESDTGGVYLQSDTLLSDNFSKKVQLNLLPSPEVYITTNNAQVTPARILGAFDNLLPINLEKNWSLIGLKILDEILIQYPQNLTPPKHILLSGGGYIQDTAPFGPFLFSDYQELALLANKLSLDTKIHGLLPGEQLDLSADKTVQTDWIIIDKILWNNYKEKSKCFNNYNQLLCKSVFNPFTSELEINSSLEIIEKELVFMSKVLICSSLGIELVSANEYMNGPTEAIRLIFNIRTGFDKLTYQYGLDLKSGKFIKMSTMPFEFIIRHFPYGIDIYLEDFYALLNGHIQIWELATANMRQWYIGKKLNSPVAFLYKYFSEQVRQDIAIKVYKNLHAQ